MAIHMVAMSKLRILSTAHRGLGPVSSVLLWPFVLKLGSSIRVVREACTDLLHALRLFVFQMGHVVFDDGSEHAELRNNSRWDRALRLVCERVTHVRRLPTSQFDQESIQALYMLSL